MNDLRIIFSVISLCGMSLGLLLAPMRAHALEIGSKVELRSVPSTDINTNHDSTVRLVNSRTSAAVFSSHFSSHHALLHSWSSYFDSSISAKLGNVKPIDVEEMSIGLLRYDDAFDDVFSIAFGKLPSSTSTIRNRFLSDHQSDLQARGLELLASTNSTEKYILKLGKERPSDGFYSQISMSARTSQRFSTILGYTRNDWPIDPFKQNDKYVPDGEKPRLLRIPGRLYTRNIDQLDIGIGYLNAEHLISNNSNQRGLNRSLFAGLHIRLRRKFYGRIYRKGYLKLIKTTLDNLDMKINQFEENYTNEINDYKKRIFSRHIAACRLIKYKLKRKIQHGETKDESWLIVGERFPRDLKFQNKVVESYQRPPGFDENNIGNCDEYHALLLLNPLGSESDAPYFWGPSWSIRTNLEKTDSMQSEQDCCQTSSVIFDFEVGRRLRDHRWIAGLRAGRERTNGTVSTFYEPRVGYTYLFGDNAKIRATVSIVDDSVRLFGAYEKSLGRITF